MAKGGTGNFFTKFLGFIKLAFTVKGAISITLILILLSTFGYIQSSVVEKDATIAFRGIGSEILNKDNNLYIDSLSIEEMGGLSIVGDGFFSRAKSFLGITGSVFTSLWYLYTFFIIFYSVAVGFTDEASRKRSNGILAGTFLTIFLVFGMLFPIGLSEDDEKILEDAPGYPFRGVVKFASVTPLLFNPLLEDDGVVLFNDSVPPLFNDTQVNSTIPVVDGFYVDLTGDA